MAARLVELAAHPPSNVSPEPWRARLRVAASFAAAWGDVAAARGWTEGELYGLHPLAPLTRLDAMGAAFCTLGRTVLEVTADAVVMAARPAAYSAPTSRPSPRHPWVRARAT